MRIVIFGLAKSGTTALFYKLKHSLPPDTICLFEPRSFAATAVRRKRVKALISGGRPPDVLAKILPFRPKDAADAVSFSAFGKQILMVRDPRDRLISRLLYGVYSSNFHEKDDKVRAFVELLKKKEADPSSVPVIALLQTFTELNGEVFSPDAWAAHHRCHAVQRPFDFHDARPNLFVYKYEEMVAQRFERLEMYLRVPLKGDATVSPELSRVVRTKRAGYWRDWLTIEDVQYLRPVLQPYLDLYYSEADWDLNPSPVIPAEHGSGYVARIVNERRMLRNLPSFKYAG